ncbi:hypothetical protein [Streptomyces brasiliscabiei]|nr:hypothetical protein [Streptomyces brasiliscabiei]
MSAAAGQWGLVAQFLAPLSGGCAADRGSTGAGAIVTSRQQGGVGVSAQR